MSIYLVMGGELDTDLKIANAIFFTKKEANEFRQKYKTKLGKHYNIITYIVKIDPPFLSSNVIVDMRTYDKHYVMGYTDLSGIDPERHMIEGDPEKIYVSFTTSLIIIHSPMLKKYIDKISTKQVRVGLKEGGILSTLPIEVLETEILKRISPKKKTPSPKKR